jgi:hypothetical protein
LRRPPAENEDFRIDRLLLRKAREGVMIYIVVYKEMSLALTINSEHTKIWLQNLHPNIIGKFGPKICQYAKMHCTLTEFALFQFNDIQIMVLEAVVSCSGHIMR